MRIAVAGRMTSFAKKHSHINIGSITGFKPPTECDPSNPYHPRTSIYNEQLVDNLPTSFYIVRLYI
jgi:hypothetical protein